MQADSQLAKQKLFDQFHARYKRVLYVDIRLIVINEAETEDVLQDSLIKIWQHWDTYNADKGELISWARQIARRTALDHYRRQAEVRSFQPLESADHLPAPGQLALTQFDRIVLATAIVRVLEPKLINVIQLFYYKGYTQQEMADELGVPVSTIKNWLRQALQLLRDYFKT